MGFGAKKSIEVLRDSGQFSILNENTNESPIKGDDHVTHDTTNENAEAFTNPSYQASTIFDQSGGKTKTNVISQKNIGIGKQFR
jgi:hypothetical protein